MLDFRCEYMLYSLLHLCLLEIAFLKIKKGLRGIATAVAKRGAITHQKKLQAVCACWNRARRGNLRAFDTVLMIV